MKKNWVSALTVLCAVFCVLALSCGSSGGGSVSTDVWEWMGDTDKGNGGSSTIEMAEGTQEGKPAYKFTGSITNDYQYGFVNVQCRPDQATLENLMNAKAISFRVLGNGEKYAVKITTSDVTDYCYFEAYFDTVEGMPMSVIVPVDHFMQPAWGKQIGDMIKLENAMFIEYQTTRVNGEPGPYEITLWDLRVWTDAVPTEKMVYSGKAPKPPKASAAAAAGVGGDLGEVTLKLQDNFQYGTGYQGVFSDARLMNKHKIVPGETFTLKATFSPSRDLEDTIECGLVDTTPAANYWRWLAGGGKEEGVAPVVDRVLKAGESVSITVTLTATAGATGTSGSANALVFLTGGEGKPGVGNSGVQKAVTLTFTEFVFTQE